MYEKVGLSFPIRQILESSKLKEFADDNFTNLMKMAESSPERVENTEGKKLPLQTRKNQGLFGKGLR